MTFRSAGPRNRREQAPRPLSRVVHLGLLLGALWLFGFLAYAGAIPAKLRDADTKVDGIIVLTGGGERLAEGVRLLRQGMARELLVSGVAEGVDLAALIQTLQPEERPEPALLECCVTLGHDALSTADNAEEGRRWLESRDMHSLRLVTANYHINRALLEFKQAMPRIHIVAHPVFPPEVLDPYWFANPRILWLLANEYHKNAASLGRFVFDAIGDRAAELLDRFWRWIG